MDVRINPICDPVPVRFETSDGGVLLEADLVELMIGVHEASAGKATLHECLTPFAAWLQKKYSVTVATSQAEIIYRTVADQYEEFKKKLANGRKSPTTSESIPADSTLE